MHRYLQTIVQETDTFGVNRRGG